MKIAVGNDHIGFALIAELLEYLETEKINFDHLGTSNTERMHYPDIAFNSSEAVSSGKYDQGILICGTGLGMSLAANQVKGIRAVVCNDPYSAKMAKSHNNANIICLGSRVIGIEMAKMILHNWFGTEFEGGRHNIRVEMINNYKDSK